MYDAFRYDFQEFHLSEASFAQGARFLKYQSDLRRVRDSFETWSVFRDLHR